ncbi:hypothetical protein [Nakamurella sp. PAMC28650]|uniref:hypothetical protein n=1 Tax=Nakamurella sp. PAMC28650 TaxID=2762325 RepID=UPI00164D3AD0|nr:hypothetical protein [Nakamurella sp. PAMC28650]QNK81996.1 hypothetical protein H7F38_04200 [Nakamurella sp. PAMC28650]
MAPIVGRLHPVIVAVHPPAPVVHPVAPVVHPVVPVRGPVAGGLRPVVPVVRAAAPVVVPKARTAGVTVRATPARVSAPVPSRPVAEAKTSLQSLARFDQARAAAAPVRVERPSRVSWLSSTTTTTRSTAPETPTPVGDPAPAPVVLTTPAAGASGHSPASSSQVAADLDGSADPSRLAVLAALSSSDDALFTSAADRPTFSPD